MYSLNSEIKHLQELGKRKINLFNTELEIFTFYDLLYYFPYKYIDRTKFYNVTEISSDLPFVQLKGIIKDFKILGTFPKQRLTACFSDETGKIELVWFKSINWIKKNIENNKEYIVFGKASKWGNKLNIVHPEIETLENRGNKITAGLRAAYNSSQKMKRAYLNSNAILKLQKKLFSIVKDSINESLPDYIIEKNKMISLKQALKNIHFPENKILLQKAQFRLKFEELFYIQLKILRTQKKRKLKFKSFKFEKIGKYFNDFYKNDLPFELTGAQKRVMKEIRRDLGSEQQCNRLLQGDVGSGKTLVAILSMLIAIDNNYQASLMAPTEVLAQQHFNTICKFLKNSNINIKLFTGSTKIKARRIIHQELENGELQIIIGTHTLIEDKVKFNNLGLVIIDEQHRFGVVQRSKMWKKNIRTPHIIVMTATPIPRTLAMTVYGDLDISVINEMPPGRKPVKTFHAYDTQRLRVFGFLRKQLEQGRQIYIVYPFIQESEKFDYKDLEDGLESISRVFPPPKYAISVLHGRMKPEEKEKSMKLFTKGTTNIMIATTVIEVGVDVPNASVMIIESAERFGLSQLHQLRGRVGRGDKQSYCILMTSFKLSKEARVRIKTMTETNDGFKIAEVDLKLRGPGNIEGTQQSGVPFDLKISNLVEDSEILQHARNIAGDIINDDPNLEKDKNKILVKQLKTLFFKEKSWEVVS